MSAGLVVGSPFFGVVFTTVGAEDRGPLRYGGTVGWSLTWILTYAAVAVGLLKATLDTFDRALGRVSDRPMRVSRPLRAKSKRQREALLS
jgi:hypothetical protein